MKDMSQLMRFRTAYLRAIAGAWSDPELLEQLTTSPYASEAGTGNTITVLREYGFDWERSPWNNVCQIQIVSGTRLEWTGDEWIWPRPAPSSAARASAFRTRRDGAQELVLVEQPQMLAADETSPSATSLRFSARRTWSTASPRCFSMWKRSNTIFLSASGTAARVP